MKTKIDSAALLWLGVVGMVALSIALLLPVTPNDYWWYLRLGRDTLANGSIPQFDTFTGTHTGQAVVYHSWGAAVLLWLVHKAGGLDLTLLLRGLLVALSYGLVWGTARRLGAGRFGAAGVLLLGVLASSNNWSLRPQLFAYPLFALALYLLYRWQDGDRRGVWFLPLVSLLWVNLHGSFVMLILLAGAALVFGCGDRRSLGLALAGILLATLLNPRGPGAWVYVVESLRVPSSQLFSAEWLPPVNDNWQMNLFFGWLLAFPLLAALAPRKPERLEWAWFLGFGLLALLGERYVIWFVLALTVLTARLLADWEARYLKDSHRQRPAVNLSATGLLLLLPLVFLPGLRAQWWPEAPPVTENTPLAATEWLAQRPDLPGPLWSEIGFSSYLEFALPERPTRIDTRFEVFSVEEWQAYQDISNALYNWADLLTADGARLLLVSTLTQPRLVEALDGSPAWCELYRDDVAVLYHPCEDE